jgi:DNA polymerase lambda
MNQKIINQFEKLIKFVEHNLNNLKDSKEINSNKFRLKQLNNILDILKSYNNKITLENLNLISKIQGIGKHTIDRIREILTNGYLSEIKDFNIDNDKDKIINEFKQIIGIGDNVALKLYDLGIISIEDLKNKIKNNEIEVNQKILLGLKYYNKVQEKIPRKNINEINDIFNNIFEDLNNKNNYEDNKKFIFNFCGSYRRKKDYSGDIDVLISKMDNSYSDNYLKEIIDILKNKLIYNDNKPLIIDDLTDKKYTTKYMGFIKYNKMIMRIDIRFIKYESYYTALLYFTGSAQFNKNMRIIAKKLNYKLSEYELYDMKKEKNIKVNSEQEIFKLLNMDYVLPELRND